MSEPRVKRLFISYSRDDIEFARTLKSHLNPLIHSGQLSVFFDTDNIKKGDEWEREINRELDQADAFIFLISHNYFSSEFVLEKEMPRMIQRYRADKVKIWPFYLAPYSWGHFKFEGLHLSVFQAIGPYDVSERLIPLLDLNPSDQAKQFTRIFEEVMNWVDQGNRERPASKESGQPVKQKHKIEFQHDLANGGKGPEMVIIPAGDFMMGSANTESDSRPTEKPQHQVSLQSFAMGKYPVSFEEYDQFAEATRRNKPGDKGWGRGTRPVINVSWQDVNAYIAWLNKQTGGDYRLPSEAEWEYAARAGNPASWFWGNDKSKAGESAWFSENSNGQTQPVGQKKANDFNLHDMAGNVWEWVEDCWHEDYKKAPDDGSAWLEADGGKCNQRVLRGGSWGYSPDLLRSANRNGGNPDFRGDFIGFRVVCCPPS